MDAKTLHDRDLGLFHANIEALKRVDATCAAAIREAQPPSAVECVVARDGEQTYAWTDNGGRRSWLGHTTMPGVRAAALIDAFNPGSQNILMVGFGQGAAIERLLGRLRPHQAVFVVEEEPWVAGLVLRLRDFSEAIQSGRLCTFVGGAAWDNLRRFLESNSGYLAPDRILAWPWFAPGDTTAFTRKLADINKQIAQQRAEALASIRSTRHGRDRTDAIVVTSSVAQPRIHRTAQMLAMAAAELGRPCETFVHDAPANVHPVAYEYAIRRLRPALIVSIESLPDAQNDPDGPPMLVLLTGHEQTLQRDKLASLTPRTFIGVCNQRQRDEAVAAGLSADCVLLTPPAACPGIRPAESARSRIAVVGDVVDCSPEAAGLNLATHQRLYRKARDLIRSAIDAGRGVNVQTMLETAEAQLKIRLESREVRAGILERIRNRLVSSQVRLSCCEALRRADIEFGVFGEGWRGQEAWQRASLGAWPQPRDLPAMLADVGMLIVPYFDETASQAVLDATAAGMVVAVRNIEKDNVDSTRPDLPESVIRYSSPDELLEMVQRFQGAPEGLPASSRGKATAGGRTWTHRLATIMTEIESGGSQQ